MSITLEIAASRRDLRRFVQFPFSLYRGCEQWIPPLIRNQLQLLGPDSNPAFEHCRTRYWVARRDGRILGRVAGIINERYVEKWSDPRARFGWLDFVDDQEVSAMLLQAVEHWAREEGMTAVHGPLGFTNLDPAGLLIEGFDEPGSMTEIYNHAYFAHHLEALGYQKDTDWVEYELTVPESIPEKVTRVGQLVLKRGGLRVVDAKHRKDLLPYSDQIFNLVNQTYSKLYGAVELTPRQIEAYSQRFFGLIDPRFNKIIVDADDRVVAFGITFPCLAEALKKARGRSLPFGFLHLKGAITNPKRLNLGLVAVRPECQGRGIPAIMLSDITKAALENGIHSADTGRELEDNQQIRSLWKSFNARQNKRRRVYSKDLG